MKLHLSTLYLLGIIIFPGVAVAVSSGGKPVSLLNANKNLAPAPIQSEGHLWKNLSEVQKHALLPLVSVWDQLDGQQKLKWLEISRRFVKMKPDEQNRMQERMRAWVALTPEQRRVAREVYSRARKLDTTQKSAQWQQYQQLPEEQKKMLMEEAKNNKMRTLAPPNGKPAIVPPLKSPQKQILQSPATPRVLDQMPNVPAAGTPTRQESDR